MTELRDNLSAVLGFVVAAGVSDAAGNQRRF
jgi:hypothetical protein